MLTPITEVASIAFIEEILLLASGQTIIWDFDGVVADTEPLQDLSYRLLSERRGWSPLEGYFAVLVGKTEEEIWHSLVSDGFPLRAFSLATELPKLKRERQQIFVELTRTELQPSWLATVLLPRFQKIAAQQVIVSNGDPDVIEALLAGWHLDTFVSVPRRTNGSDKTNLLARYCDEGSVLFEDNSGWLAAGKQRGAVTVGVRHGYNRETLFDADFVVEL